MAIIDRKGILHGRVSNIVYRNYRNIQIAQIKASKVKRTLNSKESGLEFGLCSTTAREIRECFGAAYRGYDGGMINRLTSAVRKSIMACQHKKRGERDIHDGDLRFLKGFQFNNHSPMDKALRIRPEASLTAENKIHIKLPAIHVSDVQNPGTGHSTLRFTAISFDFRKEVVYYVSAKEIKISSSDKFAGGEIELDKAMPQGTLAILSMSLHSFYRKNTFGREDSVNSKSWSPAELLDAWHVPAEEATEGELATQESAAIESKQLIPMGYDGKRILREFADLRKKAGQGKKPA